VAVVAVAVQAGQCASYGHDVVSDGEQDFPEFVGHVPPAVQQFGHVEECWEEMDPWKWTCLKPIDSSSLR
jgi:hypothetical protein